jgi:hypothetical protein
VKNTLISIFVVSILTNVAMCQRAKKYVAVVTAANGETTKGILQSVNDSTITLLKGKKEIELSTRAINTLKIRRVSAFGRGMMPGLAGGASLGFIIGYASHENPCKDSPGFCFDIGPGFSGMVGAVLGGTAGMLVGGAVSANGKHFPIDQALLHEGLKVELQKYSTAKE